MHPELRISPDLKRKIVLFCSYSLKMLALFKKSDFLVVLFGSTLLKVLVDHSMNSKKCVVLVVIL